MIKMTLKDLNAIVERTFTGRRLEPTGLLDTMRRVRGRRGLGVVGGMTTRPIISFQPKAPEMPEALGLPKPPKQPGKYPFLR
ncbi:hypothetical protein ES707_18609 [subsurface metagenome]